MRMNPDRRRWLARACAALAAPAAATAANAAGATAAVATVSPANAANAATPPSITTPASSPLDDPIRRGRGLRFPRDHGAHLQARIEWWYATGWLGEPAAPSHGFQLTFFRSATGLAAQLESRFAPRHLLFAHAALTTLGNGASVAPRHQHDQRIARWSGQTAAVGNPRLEPAAGQRPTPGPAASLPQRSPRSQASLDDGGVWLGDWQLQHQDGLWLAQLPARGFDLQLRLQQTQPLLLQGDAGFSRKGPQETQASHYYSLPQLAVSAQLRPGGPALSGRAWLDHEWSNELLHPQAVGWDWIGMNLLDGSALTAFVLRRTDGSALWAGGSFRSAESTAAVQDFAPDQVRWQALRQWRSAASGAQYPVAWALECPAGRFEVRALMDAQELDSSASTGAVYWEGLSELTDARGGRVGLGYLEMTGYAGALKLG